MYHRAQQVETGFPGESRNTPGRASLLFSMDIERNSVIYRQFHRTGQQFLYAVQTVVFGLQLEYFFDNGNGRGGIIELNSPLLGTSSFAFGKESCLDIVEEGPLG